MIFTSYYSSKLAKKHSADCVGVSIKDVHGFKYCSKLKPRKAMFEAFRKALKTGDEEIIAKARIKYEAAYKRYLMTLDVHAAYKALNGKILLCFERDSDTCHRKWIRQWFNHFGYEAEELTDDNEPEAVQEDDEETGTEDDEEGEGGQEQASNDGGNCNEETAQFDAETKAVYIRNRKIFDNLYTILLNAC